MLQELLITQGVIQIQQGDMAVSDTGIGAQGIVQAPSAMDAMQMQAPPGVENDRNPQGEM